jgi:transposase
VTTATATECHRPSAGLFAGIDVAKDKLDLAYGADDSITTVENNIAGFAKLVEIFRTSPPTLIVVEATGGLERPLLAALLDAGLNVALVNPKQVRHFALAMGLLAKTDAIDARVLRRYAQSRSHRVLQKRPEKQAELEALVVCRRQLLHVRTEQNNRLGQTRSPAARKSIQAVLKAVNKQVDSLDEQVRKLIESDDDLSDIDQRLRTVPGVGAVLSSTLLCQMSELGTLGRQEAAALVGVAPFNQDSGRFKGKRAIRGGRTSLRGVLYMAGVCAMRCNPVLKEFADRLKEAGKLPKVIIVAVMRKLIAILNAMVRDGLNWNQLDLVKKYNLSKIAAQPA